MWTVSQLARGCGLSRSTLLYYESIGLLRPASRTGANYRVYSEKDCARLRRICVYRAAGLKLRDIRTLLERPESGAAQVLQRRLEEIACEIETLRGHQRAILQLLRKADSTWRKKVITKEKWVSIMRAAGFSDADMHRWHAEFERSAPAEHQEFLEFLRVPGDEISAIREWSRKNASGPRA